MKASPFGVEQDRVFMQKALHQARRAAQSGEVPIGAVIVDAHGVVLARGYNNVEHKKLQTAHAEVTAIDRACKRHGDWRLDGCWIYVTLEPCIMCMGLIMLSRCAGIVYGAQSPLFGCGLDSINLPLYRRGSLCVVSGVAADESAALLKQFFKERRMSVISKRSGDGTKI